MSCSTCQQPSLADTLMSYIIKFIPKASVGCRGVLAMCARPTLLDGHVSGFYWLGGEAQA